MAPGSRGGVQENEEKQESALRRKGGGRGRNMRAMSGVNRGSAEGRLKLSTLQWITWGLGGGGVGRWSNLMDAAKGSMRFRRRRIGQIERLNGCREGMKSVQRRWEGRFNALMDAANGWNSGENEGGWQDGTPK
jgi:hypothetical protein